MKIECHVNGVVSGSQEVEIVDGVLMNDVDIWSAEITELTTDFGVYIVDDQGNKLFEVPVMDSMGFRIGTLGLGDTLQFVHEKGMRIWDFRP